MSTDLVYDTPPYEVCVECGIVTDTREVHFCKETVSSDMEKVFRSIAKMQEKIDSIDDSITKTKEFIEKLTTQVGPVIEKLSANPILKAFL